MNYPTCSDVCWHFECNKTCIVVRKPLLMYYRMDEAKCNLVFHRYTLMDALEVCLFGFNDRVYINIIKVVQLGRRWGQPGSTFFRAFRVVMDCSDLSTLPSQTLWQWRQSVTRIREQFVDSLSYIPGPVFLSRQRITTGLSTLLGHCLPSHAYVCLLLLSTNVADRIRWTVQHFLPMLESYLYYALSVWLQTRSVMILSLSFLVCEMVLHHELFWN